MLNQLKIKSFAQFSAALVVAATSAWSGSVIADDTEVFFPPVSVINQDTVRPNIMFIMDTSGSMSSTDGQSKDRLERMQDALIKLLSEMNQNVNVGLMRLSDDEGGPVLFPVSHIEAQASAIEKLGVCSVTDTTGTGGGIGVAVQPDIRIGNPSDTAIELISSKAVYAAPSPIFVGGTASGGGSTTKVFGGPYYPEHSYDDDETGQDADSIDLDLGERDIGIRFKNVDVPKGATITSAYVNFSEYSNQQQNNGTIKKTEMRIRGLAVDSASNYGGNWNLSSLISSSSTSASVTWGGKNTSQEFQERGSQFQIRTPNLASIIQEITSRANWGANPSARDLALLIQALDGSYQVYSYDSAISANRPALRPTLYIEYTTASPAVESAMAGLRFADVRIPAGVSLTSAVLEVTVATARTDTANMSVIGELVPDSAAFNATQTGNLSSRITANPTTRLSFAEANNWTPQGKVHKVNVTSIVQQISDQTNWCGGNAVSLFLTPNAGNTALREIVSLLSNPDAAPRLVVSYPTSDPKALTGCTVRDAVATIETSDDDVEERVNNGKMRMSDNGLDIVEDGNGRAQYVGLRFNNLKVLRNAEIVDARIEFTAEEVGAGSAAVEIYAERVKNAPVISSSSGTLTTRFATRTAKVDWAPGGWLESLKYKTPNLATIVKEIVDQSDWRPDGSMLFFMRGGQGRRVATSYDRSVSNAPRLIISYRGGVVDEGGPLGPTVRDRLRQIVGDFQHAGYTPLAEVLTEAAFYFRGENVFFGRTRGSGQVYNGGTSGQDDLSSADLMRISHCSSYTGGVQVNPSGCSDDNPGSQSCEEQKITGSPVYRTPIDKACQSNNIVLLSDGEPNNNTENGLITTMAGVGSCTGSSDGKCGIDLAAYLATKDQSSTLDGTQSITTYTIGFGDANNLDGADYLKDVAKAGKGTFFAAGSSADLANVFQSIVAEILDKNTTFVAPSVTINAFNRLSHLNQLYFALFRPTNEVRWNGNLKRFRLTDKSESIVDYYGDPAVSKDTGFFFDEATSFWTNGTADEPDGGLVAKGGAAKRIPEPGSDASPTRRVYTNVAGNAISTSANWVRASNSSITTALLGITGEPDVTNLRTKVLDWGRGVDIFDADSDGSKTDARLAMGDPLHSEPVLVSYGGTEADPDLTIFMGTNEGYLHAIDSRTGAERFSFIPKELLKNIYPYMNNQGNYKQRPYGLDGALVLAQQGTKQILIAGMRRGGSTYYALDVTNRDAPVVKWVISPTTSGFSGLGQSWSKPVVGKMKVGGAVKQVVIFGGGYDTAQDTGAATRISDAQGRALYIADLDTGALIWSAGHTAHSPTLAMSSMTASIPAAPRAVDLDSDGLIDRVYVGDTNAQIFRFDFYKQNTGATDMAKGYVYAALGGSSVADNRRFYNEIDVALIEVPDADPVLTLSVGSGYRAHPLEVGVSDRFYVLKDYDVAPVSEDSSSPKYRKAYFEVARDFDSSLDGVISTGEKAQILGPIVASEVVDVTDDSTEKRTKFSRARGGSIDMRVGEKVLTIARTFDKSVIFSTFQPVAGTGNICQAGVGTSRLYLLDIYNLGAKIYPNDPPTKQRDTELPQGGIPPNPVILFPEGASGIPQSAVICVGPYCQDPGWPVATSKTFWRD